MSTKRIIIGNWKMNPATLAEARKISGKVKRVCPLLSNTETVICPPFPFLANMIPRQSIKNFSVGAQSVSVESGSGPYTGEVSATALNDLGIKYVIVGHSEQRHKGDSDEIVAQKARNVLDAKMIAVICVGEDLRDDNGAYMEKLKNQIKNSLDNIPKRYAGNIILAYEPVWAIGAKEAMAPEQIYEASLFVKKVFADVFGAENGLKVKVLYGGAVSLHNANEIMTISKVDGLLIGRESLNTPSFIELLKAVDAIS